MKTYQKISKPLEAILTKLNTIKTLPEWLEIIHDPAAHPDLITDFATCLAAAKDLRSHLDVSVHSIQQTAGRKQELLQEIQEEAA
ncbi:MAG: hypothetical protein KME46_21955 [Brasilonema angustatum HA4187-MV1]|jgi:hypothetical protein|nr:hypothetical protein [Brasilonema angustatum HA4187-MV1]